MSKENNAWFQGAISIFKNSGIYLGFSVLNRAMPFLLLPVLTSYIDPYGFGIVTVLTIISTLLMPIIGMCSHSVLLQRFFLMDQTDRSHYVGDTYKIILANTLLLIISVYLFSSFFESLLDLPISWLVIAILTAAFGMGTTLTTELFLLKKQAFQYGLFQFINVMTTVSLVILFVVVLGLSWEGRILSFLIASVIMFLISLYIGLKAQDISISGFKKNQYFRSIIRLGLPLIPSAIGGWALAMTDRVFLTAITNLEIVGIYAVGVMFAQVIDIFLNSLARTFHPYLGRYGKSSDVKERVVLVQAIYAFIVIGVFSVIAMVFVAPTVLNIMVDERYHEAVNVIGWVSLGYMFSNIGGLFASLLLVVDANTKLMYVSITTTVAGIGLAYVLINAYGMVGAAIATAMTGFLSATLLFMFSLRYNKLPWIDNRVFQLQVLNS